MNVIVIEVLIGIILQLNIQPGQSQQCTLSTLPVLHSRQSSTYEGTFIQQLIALLLGYKSAFSASNGVDGKTISGAISGTCAQTKNEMTPWWQAQLDDSYSVTSVMITSPEICDTCSADFKLENILVEIGEVSVASGDPGWDIEWNASKQNCFFFTSNEDLSVVVNCSKPLYGNVVRLSKMNTYETTLSLCEVKISGYIVCNPEVTSMSTPLVVPVIPSTLSDSVDISLSSTGNQQATHIASKTVVLEPSSTFLQITTLPRTEISALKKASSTSVSFDQTVSAPQSHQTSTPQMSIAQYSTTPEAAPTTTLALVSWISSRYSISSRAAGGTVRQADSTLVSSLQVPSSSLESVSSNNLHPSMALEQTAFITSNLVTKIHPSTPDHHVFASSSISVSSSAILVSQTTSVLPVWCPCTCEQAELIKNHTNNSKTTEQVAEEIEEALAEMTIESKATAVNERKLMSADDKRSSAKLVGTVGVVFCTSIIVIIILSDLPLLIMTLKRVFRR